MEWDVLKQLIQPYNGVTRGIDSEGCAEEGMIVPSPIDGQNDAKFDAREQPSVVCVLYISTPEYLSTAQAPNSPRFMQPRCINASTVSHASKLFTTVLGPKATGKRRLEGAKEG